MISKPTGKPVYLSSLSIRKGEKLFKTQFIRVSNPEEVDYSHLGGPLPTSMDCSVYACTFMDQYSMFTHATMAHETILMQLRPLNFIRN